jgi:2-hydroxychromene-2-carboxylate isomerase|tara:strand:- start:1603 stop:2937 length:1335 start_codon:yes stop_codon:yes gene_type:complete
MIHLIKPRLAQLITSQWLRNLRRRRVEKRRAANNQAHQITVYLRLNDAHSYLLLQVLEQFAQRYPVSFDFRTVLNLQEDMYPAPDLWQSNAFADGTHLAQLYNLRFPTQPPQLSEERLMQLTAQLLHWELQPGYQEHALELFDAYWQGQNEKLDQIVDTKISDHAECYSHHLQANEGLLKQQGHYLSGMLHYGGEWYWGVNRLEHLELRLNEMGLQQDQSSAVVFDKSHRDFCGQSLKASRGEDGIGPVNGITIYWSMRSPYSYLALVRARQLADHYQVPLEVKPVLPMVMRRMQVPKTKSGYITADVKREADKYGIPFGRIADPLGAGVERCYALFAYAQSYGLGLSFLQSCAEGVWSQGILAESDSGLQQMVERAGLDWNQARPLLDDDSWRLWAQDNLAELYGHDLWGVPSLVYGATKVFGQDRLDRIEQGIIEDLTQLNK